MRVHQGVGGGGQAVARGYGGVEGAAHRVDGHLQDQVVSLQTQQSDRERQEQIVEFPRLLTLLLVKIIKIIKI